MVKGQMHRCYTHVLILFCLPISDPQNWLLHSNNYIYLELPLKGLIISVPYHSWVPTNGKYNGGYDNMVTLGQMSRKTNMLGTIIKGMAPVLPLINLTTWRSPGQPVGVAESWLTWGLLSRPGRWSASSSSRFRAAGCHTLLKAPKGEELACVISYSSSIYLLVNLFIISAIAIRGVEIWDRRGKDVMIW